MPEPDWIPITTMGSNYEEEIDVRAPSPRYRHRPRHPSGVEEEDWTPGPAPAHHLPLPPAPPKPVVYLHPSEAEILRGRFEERGYEVQVHKRLPLSPRRSLVPHPLATLLVAEAFAVAVFVAAALTLKPTLINVLGVSAVAVFGGVAILYLGWRRLP